MRLSLIPVLALVTTAALRGADAPPGGHFDGKSLWAHVTVLSDDNMEGRLTGSAGLRRAEAYVVEQLKADGLEPAGTDGYYQNVRLIQREIHEERSAAALVRDGVEQPVVLGEEAYFGTKVDVQPGETSAPLVFIGNGLRVPENNIDELEGLDVKGKVVVYIAGSPEIVSAALGAHYGQVGERWKMLRAAGAIGVISIPNPASMDIPWIRMQANRWAASMDLEDPAFNETTGLRLSMVFNPARAELLFAGSGHTFREIAALAKSRARLPRFPLAVAIKARADITETHVEAANVAARWRGSDPQLRDEYVVMSAHIDHLGMTAATTGDRVFNGAMDDGSGSALLLDLAASLKSQPVSLRRSILFLFVMGEEKGLLGSKHFASHPTVPSPSIIADINTDMFLPIVPLRILTIYGLAESDLGTRTAALATRLGVKPIPDPEPLRNLFVRSDQYNFIRQGIPAVIMKFSGEPGSAEEATLKNWLTQRYHAVSDDSAQPVDLQATGQFEELVRTLMIETANTPERPQWKPDSFFRRFQTKT